MEVRTEGFLLSSIPYEENSEIAAFFTPLGLYEVIRKGRGGRRDPLDLFGKYLLLLREKRDGLSRLQEAVLVDPHFFLREKIEWIESAARLWETLRRSQYAQEPEELLFQMASRFFYQIPKASDLKGHLAFFFLKLLIHEGEKVPDRWQHYAMITRFSEMERSPIPSLEKEAIFAHIERFLA